MERIKNSNLISVSFFYFLLILFIILFDQPLFRYMTIIEVGTSWRLMDLFLVSLFIILIFQNVLKNARFFPKKIKLPPIFLFFLVAFLFIGLIAILRGFEQSGTWAIGVGRYSILGIMLLPIMFQLINSVQRLKIVFKVIAYSITPIWFYHFAVDYGDYISFGSRADRIADAYTSIGLASVSMLFLSYLLFCECKVLKTKKNIQILIISASFVFVIFGQQRSVWVATFSGFVILTFLLIKEKKFLKFIKISFLISIFLVFFLFILFSFIDVGLNEKISTEHLSFITGVKNDPTGYWRYRNWIKAIEYIKEKAPYIGVGFSEGSMYWLPLSNIGGFAHSHNEYVHFFQAAGYSGLATFILILLIPIIFGLKKISKIKDSFLKSMLIGSICGLGMSSIFMLFYNQIIFMWLFMALIFIIPHLYEKQHYYLISKKHKFNKDYE